MITKEAARDFALKIKEETNKFPVYDDWSISKGFPCSNKYLVKLFEGSYNNFRDYCDEPYAVRVKEITLDFIKSNCILDKNDCWNWDKRVNSDGYGRIRQHNANCLTHRVVWLLVNGEIAENLIVLHRCNNKRCCNPSHLKLGTYSDNAIDARTYSRVTKLTKEQVIEIKKDMITQDFSIRGSISKFDSKWANQCNVAPKTIRNIRLNVSWKDVLI